MVLIGLDVKTLLLAQRVCLSWKDTIASNQKLRKKLFRKPATITEAFQLNIIGKNTLVKANRKGVCTVFNTAMFTAARPVQHYDKIDGLSSLETMPKAAAL